MIRTYKYRLYPTKNHVSKLNQTLDICRHLYNSALVDRINTYKATKKGLTYNQQQSILTVDRNKYLELKGVHSQVLQDVLHRVDKSFKNFFRRIKNKESKVGFPRFKSINRYYSFTYPQSGFEIINNRLSLSKIGHIKIKFHRDIKGNIKTCIITKEIDRWYVCFSVDIGDVPKKRTITKSVGIDVGIKHYAVLSDNTYIDNPKYLIQSENRLKRSQKLLSRKKLGSNNRKKQRILVAKLHKHISNQRKDFHHKVSRTLINNYDLIAYEDLRIKNMVKNHNLAKSIHDAGWNQFIGYINYKVEEAGNYSISINPSKTSIECSICGNLVPKNLSDRIHKCPKCNSILCRDRNASINIENRGLIKVWNEPLWRDSVVKLPYEARSFYL